MMKMLAGWNEKATNIADETLSRARQADRTERDAIAEALGIPACNIFAAQYKITARDRGRYHVAGQIAAELVQTCVVLLEDFNQTIEIPFEVEFWPAKQLPTASDDEVSATVDVDALEGEDPEPIHDGRLEIGPLLYEFLATGLDPFPRHSDAELEHTEAAAPDAPTANNPFAALQHLKGDENGSSDGS